MEITLHISVFPLPLRCCFIVGVTSNPGKYNNSGYQLPQVTLLPGYYRLTHTFRKSSSPPSFRFPLSLLPQLLHVQHLTVPEHLDNNVSQQIDYAATAWEERQRKVNQVFIHACAGYERSAVPEDERLRSIANSSNKNVASP